LTLRKEEICGTGVCLNCGKQIRFFFPYGVDLSKNTILIRCSKCKTLMKSDSIYYGDMKIQMMWVRDGRQSMDE
jgi:DNA-directed RNA polymerase subunit RPC12/RpoP